jgi:uncharacterized protein YtpQ (UPF0354 family)
MGLWDTVRGWFGGSDDGAAEPAEAPGSAPPDAPDPQDVFRDEVRAVALATGTFDTVIPHPTEYALDVVPHGGPAMACYLSNLYLETRGLSPEDRADRIVFFLSTITERPELPTDWATARRMVLPVLRPSAFFLAAGTNGERPPMAMRPFLPLLNEVLAVDLPHSLSYARLDQLDEWGVSLDEAFAQARANLESFADEGLERYDPTAKLWHLAGADDYESSRLLLDGWLAGFADRVDGTPIAAIPHRSACLVAGDADPAMVQRMIRSARAEYENSPRPISPALYTVRDGAVVPFPVDGGAEGAHEGHLMLAAIEYGEQKQVLDAWHAEQDIDVFVASLSVYRSPAGLFSVAVWGEDVDSLLPRAERIAFAGGDIEAGETWTVQVPWDAAVAAIGDALERDDRYEPPRWRTKRWVTAAEIEALRAHEIA